MRLPPGIVGRQQRPGPGGVLRPVLLAGSDLIEEIGVGFGGTLDPLPLAGGSGGAEVRPVDGTEPPGASELYPS